VVLAAGLSGLAQAAFLAGDAPPAPAIPDPAEHGGEAFEAPAELRFGVGAWPSVAAAIVAHLLYLLAEASTHDRSRSRPGWPPEHPAQHPVGLVSEPGRPVSSRTGVQAAPVPASYAPALPAAVQSTAGPDDALSDRVPSSGSGVGSPGSSGGEFGRPTPMSSRPSVRSPGSPQSDRARAAAVRLARNNGALPTVTRLMAEADVSRGTAGEVLKALREQPTPLHLVTDTTEITPQP
jgi:hypothetical protein